MSIVWEIWNAIHGIITGAIADPIALGIMLVVIVGAGFMMQGLEALVTTTLVAMLAFGLLGYVRAVTLGKQPAAAFATTDWHNFTTTTGLTLLAYALIFAVGIAIVQTVRSLVFR
jgi:VIT1/CCC1 family predicted Fe2+/Mn2+ transporter